MRRLGDLLLLLPLAAGYAVIARMNPEFAAVVPGFLLFAAAFVLLPAIGLGGLLLRQPLTAAERLGLGGPAALALLFGLSYATALLRLPWLIWLQPALGVAACAASFALSSRSAADAEAGPSTWPDLWLMLAVLAAGLALCLPEFLATSAPTAQTLREYYNDDVGQSAFVFAALRAMKHGLPVWDPLVAGTKASYHLLMHFDYAAGFLVTGAHPMDQVMFLWPPLLWLLLASGVVAACRRLAGFTPLETAVAATALIFCGGPDFLSTPAVQLFSYQHPYFIGLPGLLLFLTALYGRLSGRVEALPVLPAAVGFLVCAATKAQLMLLLPLALLPVLVLLVIRREAKLADFLLAALCLGVVALMKLTIYPDTARVALELPRLGKLVSGSIGNLVNMGFVVGAPVLFALLASQTNPVLQAKLERGGRYHLFCLCYVIVAAILLRMFNFIGADFYFFWHARAIVFLACAPALAHCLRWRTPRFAPAAILLLMVGVSYTVQWQFFPNIFGREDAGKPQVPAHKSLDGAEREGLRWTTANLDGQARFFTNKNSFNALYLGGYHPQPMQDYIGWSGLQSHALVASWLPEPVLKIARDRAKRQQAFLAAKTPEARAEALANLADADYYFHSVQRDPAFTPPDCLREVHRTASLVIYRNLCATGAAGTAANGQTGVQP